MKTEQLPRQEMYLKKCREVGNRIDALARVEPFSPEAKGSLSAVFSGWSQDHGSNFGLCATASESSETQCLRCFSLIQRALHNRRRSYSGTINSRRSKALVILAFLFAAWAVQNIALAENESDFFEAKIRPVLVGTCFRCHGDLKAGGTLKVDSREALLKGGESGPALVPGKSDESLLIKAIQRHEGVSAMPPEKEKALRPDEIAAFVTWVNAGAAWPAKTATFETAKHWAFEPMRDVALPAVRDQAWMKTSIDHFIRAKQEAAGVLPASPADKLTLIRRATFDLTGLPPTPEAIDAFERDTSSQAFEAVVDRLLISPAYGERWGRHWLDVVRYADTAGETADYPVRDAWRYRNYVIDSFNRDKPYDEFLHEQIAGDILAVNGSPHLYAERTTATGYLAISRRFGFDSENYHHLTIQDTIDTLGQTVLGLSLGCARCHDHKFDPLSMHDYYALYGIFDSSRYSFPGSEQKQKFRSMVPLLPPSESLPKWREFDLRVATIASNLEKQKQPVPAAVLRSLNDLDGDFEMQAAAAGGSNGVLVPPWLYEGKIAVTNAAQSPFKNLYPRGKVGASIASGVGEYRIAQAIYPQRSHENCDTLHVNLDFRVTASDSDAKGVHRFWIGAMPASSAVEVLISSESVSLQIGDTIERLCTWKTLAEPVVHAIAEPVAFTANQWHNLQLALDFKNRTLSGKIGMPGSMAEFSGKALSPSWLGTIDIAVLDSFGRTESTRPAIEFDNLGVQESPIAPVSTELPLDPIAASGLDPVALTKELDELTGFDGDFELQAKGEPPASPWGPGPNSVVTISAASQSPFLNAFAVGEFGIHMPNRGEYDGFGRTVANANPKQDGQLFASFDFRCANKDAGGNGSWRYYLGHGPGNSAAIELYFNGSEFFRRSADARESVCPLVVGEWYQVQLTLDLKSKSYTGLLASRTSKTEFSGQLATGWDGTIDYTFIDSYGHIGGVRPSLDADNFAISLTAFPTADAIGLEEAKVARESRRVRVAELRRQLASLVANVEVAKQELNRLLADGPFQMTYGMAEGTPHNVRMQMRGEPDRPGVEVPRGFIKVLDGGPLQAQAAGSGRLELAQWLTRSDNPLTARVMVNRIWQFHFGRGLVKTPNDFGVRGLPPTHPELLDHLAHQFIRSGWSMKAMHRLMMSSATYQQSSVSDATQSSATSLADDTDLYIRFSRRRLSAEEIRDAILAVSHELDSTPAQEHPFPTPIGWGYTQHGPFSAVYDHNKRSIYLMTQRLKRHPFLALFDGADSNTTTAERAATTVPTQSLFFLNDPFVHAKAEKCARRLRVAASDVSQQIEMAYRLTIGRLPTEIERAEATRFLQSYREELIVAGQDNIESRALAAYVRTLFGCNEFLHLD